MVQIPASAKRKPLDTVSLIDLHGLYQDGFVSQNLGVKEIKTFQVKSKGVPLTFWTFQDLVNMLFWPHVGKAKMQMRDKSNLEIVNKQYFKNRLPTWGQIYMV